MKALILLLVVVCVGCGGSTEKAPPKSQANKETVKKPNWAVEIDGYNLRRWDCPKCQAKVSSLEFDCPKCDAAIDFSDQQPNESDAEFKERVAWEKKALGN